MLKQYENHHAHPNISGISIPREYADAGKSESCVPGHPECVLNRGAYKTMGNFLQCQKGLDAKPTL